jgi:diguanylate cyclase (GGDEF)-like protein/PAS domain S-box-containing protein
LNLPRSFVGKRPEEVLPADIAARLVTHYKQCVDGRTQVSFEGSFGTPAGTRWSHHVLTPIFDLTGRIVRIMGTIIDITPRKLAEQALQESEERFHALYDDNPARFVTIDVNGRVLSINKFGAERGGYTQKELVGTDLFDYLVPADQAAAKRFLATILREPDRLHRAEFRTRKKDGTILWSSDTARVIRDKHGNEGILIVSEDISETCRLAEELSYQASHDSLTGLVNRRELERRLQELIQSARDGKAQHAFCYLDLDQFKVINDTCGHLAGDEMLRQLGKVLEGTAREGDTLARMGGDEFGLLLRDCSLEQAADAAAALCRSVEAYRFPCKGKVFSIGVSVGVVPITETSGNVTSVLAAADRACYAAKDKGRNRFHLYREDDAELAKQREDMQWANRILQALAENRLHLYAQTIRPEQPTRETGEHYELLLRLEDETGRMVPAKEFISAAERYSVATKLDRWVVKTAFAWLRGNPDALQRLGLCSLNLSGATLGDETFLDFVLAQLDESGVPPGKICFEVTETTAITNLTNTTRLIEALRGRGCRFSLDDFGSGLSSFAYLRNLPVEYLKIDGTFVRDIANDPISYALVKSINEIGHIMGKKTIAESVENEAILGRLREIGVDYYQGFGIGHPKPITAGT